MMTDFFEIMYGDESDRGCKDCGGDAEFITCHQCEGTGIIDEDDLMEEDPLWYMPGDIEKCSECGGKGGFEVCVAHCQQAEVKPYDLENLVTVIE
jgi:hypothetical protein